MAAGVRALHPRYGQQQPEGGHRLRRTIGPARFARSLDTCHSGSSSIACAAQHPDKRRRSTCAATCRSRPVGPKRVRGRSAHGDADGRIELTRRTPGRSVRMSTAQISRRSGGCCRRSASAPLPPASFAAIIPARPDDAREQEGRPQTCRDGAARQGRHHERPISLSLFSAASAGRATEIGRAVKIRDALMQHPVCCL